MERRVEPVDDVGLHREREGREQRRRDEHEDRRPRRQLLEEDDEVGEVLPVKVLEATRNSSLRSTLR